MLVESVFFFFVGDKELFLHAEKNRHDAIKNVKARYFILAKITHVILILNFPEDTISTISRLFNNALKPHAIH